MTMKAMPTTMAPIAGAVAASPPLLAGMRGIVMAPGDSRLAKLELAVRRRRGADGAARGAARRDHPLPGTEPAAPAGGAARGSRGRSRLPGDVDGKARAARHRG